DVKYGNFNRTFTDRQITLAHCTAGGAPPVVADFDGDGINDIAVVEASDCKGSPPYTLNVLLGNADGTFRPEQVVRSSSDLMYEWHGVRVSPDSKPDLEVFSAHFQNGQLLNPEQLLLTNISSGHFPACSAPNFRALGLSFCSPTETIVATSPV